MNQNTDFVPFARPSIGVEEENAVLEIMRSGWLTTGKAALAFEREFASYLGVDRALSVNSATSGLHLALESLRIGPGDVVIMSPWTFASSAAVVRHLGAEVAFCDIGKDDFNIDADRLEECLSTTRNARAIIPVHVGGLPCRMDRIMPLAEKYGCYVVEDAAHSFPSKTASGYAGTIGDIGVYSFYATKTITTGEGGMVVSKNPDTDARMSLMRMHGIDRPVWDRYTSDKPSWYYQIVEAGFKYNLPDILAAIGREQLKKAARFLEEREIIAQRYDEAFRELPGVELPPRGEGHAWHLYAISLDPEKGSISRDSFVSRMTEAGVGTSVHFIPLHLHPYWAKRYHLDPSSFPNASSKYEKAVSLPVYQGMPSQWVDKVIESVTGALSGG